ncbi:MAG: hypothetical protein H6733_10900 [Alphaproteobacteria bacterium]|nr:hypothetical protein [Alphaproteobacteria bacterium]
MSPSDVPRFPHRDLWEDLVDATFGLRTTGEPLPLRLAQVVRSPRGPGPTGVEPYELVFFGPAEPVLAGATYALVHDDLGEVHVFLVPRGVDDRGVMYTADVG